MNKNCIISAASYYNKKYYFNPDCGNIPDGVKKELEVLCKTGAEMLQGIFDISFDQNGSIVFEASGAEDDFDFDEIGSRIITDKLVKDNEQLVKSLQLWHALYKTEKGQKVREKLLNEVDKNVIGD